MMLRAQGIAHLAAVLMSAHAAQLYVAAVQEKALLRVDAHRTQTKRAADAVHAASAAPQRQFGPVEEGVAPSVPEMRAVDGHGQRVGRRTGGGGQAQAAFAACHLAPAVGHAQAQRHVGRLVQPVVEADDGPHVGPAAAHAVLHEAQAARAVVEQRDARGVGRDEVHVAVEAAVEVEVAHEGHEREVLGVVHAHEQVVVGPIAHLVRDFHGKGAVAPAVAARMASVHEDVGHVARPLEAQEEAPPLPGRRHVELFPVVAHAALIVLPPRQGVVGVPRMGQVLWGKSTRRPAVRSTSWPKRKCQLSFSSTSCRCAAAGRARAAPSSRAGRKRSLIQGVRCQFWS